MCASLVFAVRPCHGRLPCEAEARITARGKEYTRWGGWVENKVQARHQQIDDGRKVCVQAVASTVQPFPQKDGRLLRRNTGDPKLNVWVGVHNPIEIRLKLNQATFKTKRHTFHNNKKRQE